MFMFSPSLFSRPTYKLGMISPARIWPLVRRVGQIADQFAKQILLLQYR